jgi:regulator of protease activity HflC (stomatin/prohibitin superfamily)
VNAGLIAAAIAALVVLIVILRSIKIVPQARGAVIERLGRYTRTATPGVNFLVPFFDRMRPLLDLREQVVSFPPQPVITADNLTVAIDSVIYFQVTDPRAATYEIANYIQAVEQLTITTLRNVVGALNLEQTLTSRDSINTQLRGVLDEATGPWGIRVARVELKAIDPPLSIQDAMEKQMRADRDKRAIILQAEGQRESAIKSAEGQKAAQILSAEGQKQAVILAAEADRQSRILRAEGERASRYLTAQGQAKAIETTFAAIHNGKLDPAMLAYQYLQTLPQLAQGDANKMWILPSEFSRALDGLANLGGGGGDGAPSWLAKSTTPESAAAASGSTGAPLIDTSDWFDSKLPAAADLPERANLFASDDDSASMAAHFGLPTDTTIGDGPLDSALNSPAGAAQPPFPAAPLTPPGAQSPASQPAGYAYPAPPPSTAPPGYAYPGPAPYQYQEPSAPGEEPDQGQARPGPTP